LSPATSGVDAEYGHEIPPSCLPNTNGNGVLVGGSSISGSTTVSETAGSTLPLPGNDTNGFAQAIAGPNDLGVYANVTAAEGSASQIAAISADVFAEL